MRQVFNISNSWQREAGERAILEANDNQIVTFELTIRLSGMKARERAISLYRKLTSNWRAVLSQINRSKEQNDKMWAMLRDLSSSKPLGREYTAEQWKAVMMREAKYPIGYLHDLSGEPFPIGYRSSKLTIGEMADLITAIDAFGNQNGVQWSNESKVKPDAGRLGD